MEKSFGRKNHRNLTYERQDVLDEFINMSKVSSHLKMRSRQRVNTVNESTNLDHQVRLNKKKKYQLEEERNTEIDRSNRILYQKIARVGRNSQPSTLHSASISRTLKKQKTKMVSAQKINSEERGKLSKKHESGEHSRKQQQSLVTLFMGHDFIDSVKFKIKLMISDQVYYLVAKNQHSKIILEMPQDEYWSLHYGQLEENPCNIFPYLEIQKGKVGFRVRKDKEKERKRSLPKGIGKSVKLPMI